MVIVSLLFFKILSFMDPSFNDVNLVVGGILNLVIWDFTTVGPLQSKIKVYLGCYVGETYQTFGICYTNDDASSAQLHERLDSYCC